MQYFYINLDTAFERKRAVEENFQAHNSQQFQLNRFPAVDGHHIKANQIQGSLRTGEMGCFLSHQAIIEKYKGTREPIWIMEDDIEIGASTMALIASILKTSNEFQWDVIFTDICIPQPGKMAELIQTRKRLAASGEVELMDLKTTPFAGSTSYLVNPKSMFKMARLLSEVRSLDVPYDLYLRKLVYENKLTGYFTFPFITTLSSQANTSGIQLEQTAYTDLVWNTFRQMVWKERSWDKVNKSLLTIYENVCDDESNLYSIVLSACLSDQFTPK